MNQETSLLSIQINSQAQRIEKLELIILKMSEFLYKDISIEAIGLSQREEIQDLALKQKYILNNANKS